MCCLLCMKIFSPKVNTQSTRSKGWLVRNAQKKKKFENCSGQLNSDTASTSSFLSVWPVEIALIIYANLFDANDTLYHSLLKFTRLNAGACKILTVHFTYWLFHSNHTQISLSCTYLSFSCIFMVINKETNNTHGV